MTHILSNDAVKWLAERGIDPETAVKLNLFSASPTASKGLQPDPNGRWIGFPYMRHGQQVGCKYRYTVEKRFMQDKGSGGLLWNRESIIDADKVVITEGEIDAASAIEGGYSAAVSVPDGAPAQGQEKSHSGLLEALDDLQKAKEIILAFDNDGPGANLFEQAKSLIGPARCKFVTYPPGCKDLNDVLRKFGPEVVGKVLDQAKDVPVDGLYTPADLPDLPDLQVYRCGLSDDADKRIGICRRHTSVWTGFANHGKSVLIKAVMVGLAKRHGWKMGVASMEDDYQRNYRGDIAQAWGSKRLTKFEPDELAAFNAFYQNHWVLMQPPENEVVTLEWLFNTMEAAVIRHGVDMLVIDPFTEIDLQLDGRKLQHEIIGEALSAFNRFARRYNVHVAIVAHPSKPGPAGEKYCPTGYDISGSAHWKNKPYLGVSIHRDPKLEDVNQVLVWKSKRQEIMGRTGVFYLRYSPEAACFVGLAADEYQMRIDGDIQ